MSAFADLIEVRLVAPAGAVAEEIAPARPGRVRTALSRFWADLGPYRGRHRRSRFVGRTR